ncbi:MAG: FkbM family methyltransferase [Myxococcota bacterium]
MANLLRALYRTAYPALSGSGIHRFRVVRWLDRRLRQRLTAREIVVEGHRLTLDPEDSLRLSVMGCYQPGATALLKRRVRTGAIVVDVGAHIGYFTLLLARCVGPEGRVYAFEPDAESFALLERNVAANGYQNVVLEHAAVGSRSGRLRMFRSQDNAADHRTYDPGDPRRGAEVRSVSLDEYFRDREEEIALVKIDVQGFETVVLAGMKRLVEQKAISDLLIEFWPEGLSSAGSRPRDLLDALAGCGYRIWEIEEAGGELRPTSPEGLCQRYTPERCNFTDLYCSRPG